MAPTTRQPASRWRRAVVYGAPERIRTSDPQIRSSGLPLFLLDFLVNFSGKSPRIAGDTPVNCKPKIPMLEPVKDCKILQVSNLHDDGILARHASFGSVSDLDRHGHIFDRQGPPVAYHDPKFILPGKALRFDKRNPFRKSPVCFWPHLWRSIIDLSRHNLIIVQLRGRMCPGFEASDQHIRLDLDAVAAEFLGQLRRSLIAGTKDKEVILGGGGVEAALDRKSGAVLHSCELKSTFWLKCKCALLAITPYALIIQHFEMRERSEEQRPSLDKGNSMLLVGKIFEDRHRPNLFSRAQHDLKSP